ncbi:thiosulfate sulfurtransferase GlpE [uncultured Psychrosphaera sp.]|jgi:thiosulfate sulfurtransferase|uniref:thiosulfate sulfurtransferase GlpE n=1 Tax=uncultured Psychrosphaera sp. TaxID=1403522 RepID=UPI0026134AE5|nr:thiosulfate sulfurtransferase GlpE [uncultured Psychrosphaera sp.]
MSEFKRISVAEAHKLIEAGHVVIADIRDDQSFASGHVENAFHLSNASMSSFSQKYDYETPVLVFCYHGNSSQGAAQYLAQEGFDEVYSVDGGFEMWKLNYPFVTLPQ